MKKLLFIFIGIILILSACSKTDTTNPVESLQSAGTVSETYDYQGTRYTLYFNASDYSDVPINTEVANTLIAAINGAQYILAYYEDVPDVTFIENLETQSESGQNAVSNLQFATFAQFYEHSNFGGNSFFFSNFSSFIEALVLPNGFICSEAHGISDLNFAPFPGGGSWDNKISSFKLFQDGATKAALDAAGYIDPGTHLEWWMHKHPNFSSSGCAAKKWVFTAPPPGTSKGPWEISNLAKERWGFLCAKMNDAISSTSFLPCQCTNIGACLTLD